MFVVSDFLDDGYMSLLRSAHRRHDVVAVQIFDEREQIPVNAGLLTLQDAETGREVLVDTGSASFRRLSSQRANARFTTLKNQMVSAGIDMIQIDASKSVVDPLVAFFRMRRKRVGR